MGRRRGFFAELQHQARLAEREGQRREREESRLALRAEREYQKLLREEERLRKDEERALHRAERDQERELKRLAREANAAHVERMLAEAERKNQLLAAHRAELDTLLHSTLEVDDYVDLESLRVAPVVPQFDGGALEQPTSVASLGLPPEPVFNPPAKPRGLLSFLKKRRYEGQLEQARERYDSALEVWTRSLEARREEEERRRLKLLAEAKQAHQQHCQRVEHDARMRNGALDTLIANLGYGVQEAVEEYISIVLANSVYPEHFDVAHEFSFKPDSAELDLKVFLPPPDQTDTSKSYKYNKSSDEIVATSLSQKAMKDLYLSCVEQVSIRTLHEVFEADRRELISAISMELGTDTVDPATGLDTWIPFVAVAVDRSSFVPMNLERVVPSSTLEFLGAAVSKNPFGLKAIDPGGIRRA